MKILWCFLFFLLFNFNNILGVYGKCTLLLNKDFGVPSPVYLQKDKFLAPNSWSGNFSLRTSEHILVACTGDRRHVLLGNYTTNNETVEARCVSNSTFRAGQWTGLFKDIRCNTQPFFTAEELGPCLGRNTLYRVGYKIRKDFYALYEACFDRNLLSTLYVKHHLTPASKYTQNGGSRPQFVEGHLFGKTRMSQLYKTKNQKARLNAALGDNMDLEYLTKNQFLTRGHLAPRADFPMRAAQRASFHYVNSAPQWMRGNAGDWAALEDALRRHVHAHNATLTIYTGTHEVLTLRSRAGKQEKIYLDTDANNNYIVPVPLYFYKLVYDSQKKTAAAFVSINSSYYNRTMLEHLSFCNDICEENPNYSWLRWRSNDGTHSFCCEYEEFVRKINYLPRLDVKGLFY